MTNFVTTDDLFFNRAGLNQARVEELVDEALGDADDGELFLEYRQSESVVLDDGRVRSAAFAPHWVPSLTHSPHLPNL